MMVRLFFYLEKNEHGHQYTLHTEVYSIQIEFTNVKKYIKQLE